MNKTIFIISALWLAACAAVAPPTPVPTLRHQGWFAVETRDAAGQTRNSLLAVAQSSDGIRFVQTDALGAPLARQVFSAEGWRNDGFVMPNRQAARAFAAMLPLLAADEAAVYPQMRRQAQNGARCYLQGGKTLWCSGSTGGGWFIRFPDGSQWRLEAAEGGDGRE